MLQSKFWQGFFAIAPIAMLFLGMIAYFVFLFFILNNVDALDNDSGNYSASLILGNVGAFVLFILVAICVSLGSLVFYIVHIGNYIMTFRDLSVHSNL